MATEKIVMPRRRRGSEGGQSGLRACSHPARFIIVKRPRNPTEKLVSARCRGLCRSPCRDKSPHRIHLFIPWGLWVGFFGQFVKREPDGALNSGARLLFRLPLGDARPALEVADIFRD